jgi:hypothetical protein
MPDGSGTAPLIFPNLSQRPEEEVIVRLDVGPAEKHFYRTGGPFWIPEPRFARNTQALFLFDSGAQLSILSGSLAVRLGLNLMGPVQVVFGVVDSRCTALETTFRVYLDPEWLELPCLVPCSGSGDVDPLNATENLLGLGGLFPRFEIMLACRGMELRRNT